VLVISESLFQLHKDSVNSTHNLPTFPASNDQIRLMHNIFKGSVQEKTQETYES